MDIKSYQLCYGSSSESDLEDGIDFNNNPTELKQTSETHPRIKESENLILMCLLMRGNGIIKKNNIMSYCRKHQIFNKTEDAGDYKKLDTVKRLFENEKYKEVIKFL